tara:strand:+ start:3302 stop:3760 length:459 start_codon:yes stop_codon:yes gene_type:complete
MKTYLALLLFALTPLTGTPIDSDNQLKSTALHAVDLLFFQGDNQAFIELVSPTAERKTGGQGSAVEGLKKQKEGSFTRASATEIIFVTPQNIADLKEEYPDDMWDQHRASVHLKDGLGCLVLVDVGKEKKGMMFFALKEIDGQIRITYFDDN